MKVEKLKVEFRVVGSLLMGVIGFMASFSASGDGLVIAREALRDGLWDVARTHAA